MTTKKRKLSHGSPMNVDTKKAHLESDVKPTSEGTLLVDDIRNKKTHMDALRRIISSTGDEAVQELTSTGGRADDLLIQLDPLEKTKPAIVQVILQAAEKFLIYAPANFSSELAHKLLVEHMRYIITFLSPTGSALHNITALRLLTSMVATGNEASAKDLLVKLNFEHIYFEQLFLRRASEVRKTYIYFLLSFFVSQGPIVLKEYIDKAGKRIAAIVHGLREDPLNLVLFVMEALKDKLMANPILSKTSKMKIFNTVILKKMSELMKSEGGWTESEDAESAANKATVCESIFEFLKYSLTSVKTGLIFFDESVGNSGVNRNHLLLTFLQTMKSPWENEWHEKLVIVCLSKCPDQLRPYLSSLSLSAPRDSEGWYRIANFMRTLIKELDLESKVLSGNLIKKYLITTLSNVAFPEVVIKEVVKPALKPTCGLPVQRGGIDVLHDIICQIELLIFKTERAGLLSSSIRTQLVHRYKERVPPLDDILAFWTLEKGEATGGEYLCKTAKVLDFYLNFLRLECETIDTLLGDILLLEESVETNKATLYFLKYQTSSFTTTKKQFDNNYIEILFNVALKSDDEAIRSLAITTLFQIFGIQNGLTSRIIEFEILISVSRKMKIEYSSIVPILNSNASNLSDLNEQIFELKTKVNPSEDDSSSLPVKNKMVEKFLDRIIDHESDDITEIMNESNSFLSTSQNSAQLELSPLTLILLKSFKPSLPWIIEYIKLICYCQGNFEELASVTKGFIKDKALGDHFDTFRFGTLDKFEDETQTDVTSLSAFIALSKLMLMYRFQRVSADESRLISHLQSLLLSSKNVRQSLLLDTSLVLDLFKPYSPVQSGACRMILSVLSSNPGLISGTLFKRGFVQYLKESASGSISPELLHNCLSTFKFDSAEIEDMLRALVLEKNLEDAHWLLHFSLLLMHCPNSTSSIMEEFTEVIREAIFGIISLPTCHGYLLSIIKFCETNLCFSLSELCLSEFISPMLEAESTPIPFLSYLMGNDMNSSAKVFRKTLSKNKGILSAKWKALAPILISSIIKKKIKKKFVVDVLIDTLKATMGDSIKNNNEPEVHNIIIAIVSTYPDLNLMEMLEVEEGEFIPSVSSARCLLRMANESVPFKTIANKILMPILKMISQRLKNPSEESKELIEDCQSSFTQFLKLDLSKVMKYMLKHNEAFWINTIRTFLKHGLKLDSKRAKGNFRGLPILSELIKYSYTEGHEHLSTIYEMVHGHSNFLKLMFSNTTEDKEMQLLKRDLLKFISSVLSIYPDLVVSEHIPLYLGAYGSSLSESDQCILSILNHHEQKHSFSSFQPIVWGDFAVSRYTIGSSEKKSLWKVPRCSEILSLIDADRMYETAVNFPIDMKFFDDDSCGVIDPKKYDPRFYLPLFSSLCSPQSYIDKHLKVLESGGLGLALAALSSKDENMRALGYTVVSRIFAQFEGTKFAKEKMIWLHFLNMIRNGARESKNSDSNPALRIPSIVSVFLVKTIRILKNPLHHMYKHLSHFLLAKPFLDLFNVPDFFSIFHSMANANESSGESPRKWILCVIRDGLKDRIDYHVISKLRIIRLLLSYHTSVLSTNEEEIFNVLERCMRLKEGAADLIKSQGFLIWVLSRGASPRRCAPLLTTAWESLSHDKMNPDLLGQFLCALKGLLLAGGQDHSLLELLAKVVERATKESADLTLLLSREEFLEILQPSSEKAMQAYNRVLLVLK